ncbi:MAG: hypothetical protein PHR30_14215 [Gallionellaceae bacterium]|nr:hypothetical protein [Gallionellaceae bacterium]
MPYVQRDDAGKIVSISTQKTEPTPEWVAEGSLDLTDFILDMATSDDGSGIHAVRALGESDLALIRVVEDIVDLLIEKNLLLFTDLPVPAQEKLLARRSLRDSLNPLTLMKDDDGVI